MYGYDGDDEYDYRHNRLPVAFGQGTTCYRLALILFYLGCWAVGTIVGCAVGYIVNTLLVWL